jgi:hypothetical protein
VKESFPSQVGGEGCNMLAGKDSRQPQKYNKG